jgi:hypothetical protein
MFVVKAMAVHHAALLGTFFEAASVRMAGMNMAAHAMTKLKMACGGGVGGGGVGAWGGVGWGGVGWGGVGWGGGWDGEDRPCSHAMRAGGRCPGAPPTRGCAA